MAYNKTVWINGAAPALNADNLNKIENALEAQDEDISSLKSDFANIDGFTLEIKSALMDVVEHIGAWSDGNAQTYIQNLRDALYPSEPPTELVSISAVFTQGDHTIYNTDALGTLKQYLVVTAHYDDSSTAIVASADYTLSGTLTERASTITVSYGGYTDSFVVTVTAASSGEVELQDIYTDLGITQANVYEGADATSTKLCTYYTTSMFGFVSDETFSTDTVVNIKASATNLTGRHIFAGSASDFTSTTLDAFYGADLGAISSMGNGVSFTVKAGNKLVIICNFQRNTDYSLTVSAERS